MIMRKERGFTLVEIMAAMAIFLVVLAVVFGIYLQANRFIAMFSAKDDIFHSMNIFARQVSGYLEGASKVFSKIDGTYEDWTTWGSDTEINNIVFCTKYIDEDALEHNAVVRVFNEPVKDSGAQLYFKDQTQGGQCLPLQRTVIQVKEIPTNTCYTDAGEFQKVESSSNFWQGAKSIMFVPRLVDARNSFSYISFQFQWYSLEVGDGKTMKWPNLRMKSVFGVLRNIYDDSSCTHRVRGYAVNVYPYVQVFTVYGRNIER